MTKYQEAVKDKLKSVCDQALDLKIRLLIECELSGKLWIYCDAKDKRTVIKLLRQNRITNRKHIFAEGYNTKFLNPYPYCTFIEMDKGNKVKRLQRIRPCISETVGRHHVWFYYMDTDMIDRIKSTALQFGDFRDIKLCIDEHFNNIAVNYSGDDLMFYGI